MIEDTRTTNRDHDYGVVGHTWTSFRYFTGRPSLTAGTKRHVLAALRFMVTSSASPRCLGRPMSLHRFDLAGFIDQELQRREIPGGDTCRWLGWKPRVRSDRRSDVLVVCRVDHRFRTRIDGPLGRERLHGFRVGRIARRQRVARGNVSGQRRLGVSGGLHGLR